MFIHINKPKAQSITEYAVLMGIIVLAIVLTQVYLKRSVQGKFKSSADDIGEQFTTGQTYTEQKVSQGARREATGVVSDPLKTKAELELSWSQSTIQDTAGYGSIGPNKLVTVAGLEPKLDQYAGHEVSQSDFVMQDVGKELVAAHTTFSSGKLQSKNPFEEALGKGTE